MLCDLVANAQSYSVESYLYYIILVNKKNYFLRSETREKINRQYTYIVKYIIYIYKF
jgi:hypothetical protein